jgi:hypothetical protein
MNTRSSVLTRGLLLATALVALAAAVALGLGARRWIGQPFPGFFVLANRVVPSVGLPHWAGSREGTLYQRTLVAIDKIPVASSADVYRRIAERPTHTRFRYTLRHGAATETVTLASDLFSPADYWAIFGAYVLSGLLYLLLAVLAAWLHPDARLGRALLYVGATGGIYAFTAVELYGSDGPIRVHALSEAFFPAAVAYLALVFPRTRDRLVLPLGAAAWWLSLALAVPYQLLLGQPGAYSVLHAACETYLAAVGLVLIVGLIVEHARAGAAADPLLRAGTAGALLGLGVPAVVLLLSGVSGGALPVNVCAATAFLFPLCVGYGLIRTHVAARRVRVPAVAA